MPVCRSLGRAGIPVHGALSTPDEPLRDSRYCHGFCEPVAGEPLQETWLRWLLGAAPAPAVVLATSDDGLEVMARHRSELEERGYLLGEQDDDVVLAMLDKQRTYSIARAAGVATPDTHTVRSEADMGPELDRFEYPCGLKPVHGHLFAQLAPEKGKVLVVADRAELERKLRRMLSLGLEMQVTELVPGGDDSLVAYFTYMDESGEPLMHFTNRKLRQQPIHFGVGTYVVGEWLPDVAEQGLRFLRGAELRGIAHVEFKRDARDGSLKLIECNHRFNLAIGLLCASGLDLPLFAYERALGRPGPSLDSPRFGLRLLHPLPDAVAFLHYRAAGELSTRRWLRSLAHRQHFSLWARDDPLPSLRAHARAAAALPAHLTRRPEPAA